MPEELNGCASVVLISDVILYIHTNEGTAMISKLGICD
jgi:hypothetical protein